MKPNRLGVGRLRQNSKGYIIYVSDNGSYFNIILDSSKPKSNWKVIHQTSGYLAATATLTKDSYEHRCMFEAGA